MNEEQKTLSVEEISALIPEGYAADELQLLLHDGNSWKAATFRVDGSYLVFQIPENLERVRLDVLPVDYSPYFISSAAVILISATIVLITVLVRKKKSR